MATHRSTTAAQRVVDQRMTDRSTRRRSTVHDDASLFGDGVGRRQSIVHHPPSLASRGVRHPRLPSANCARCRRVGRSAIEPAGTGVAGDEVLEPKTAPRSGSATLPTAVMVEMYVFDSSLGWIGGVYSLVLLNTSVPDGISAWLVTYIQVYVFLCMARKIEIFYRPRPLGGSGSLTNLHGEKRGS